MLQIGFIGPLNNKHPQKYACTIVDIYSGIGIATATGNLTAHAACRALDNWLVHSGAPKIIESDQGTHFTARYTQDYAKEKDI